MLGRWIIVSAGLLAVCCNPVLAAWTSFQASNSSAASPPAVVCNFKTGVATGVGAGTCVSGGAACNGSMDDTAAFQLFATWALGWQSTPHVGQIELFIPSGNTCTLDTPTIPFDGIRNLLVSGYGATLKTQTEGFYHLGSASMVQDSAHSVRLNAANAGDTTITVNPASATQPTAGSPVFGCASIAACTALFTVGNIAVITGLDLQSGNGFPPNPFYYEYVTPTNINSSTGVITLAAPLKLSYKTTWPNFGFGSQAMSVPDSGGPATLYALPASYNATFEYDGLTFAQVNTGQNQVDVSGRTAILKDTTWTFVGQGCPFPTVNVTFTITNTSAAGCDMEIDKIVPSVAISNSTFHSLSIQSATPQNLTLNNFTAAEVIGTPQNLTISNSTLTDSTHALNLGPKLYGRTDNLTVSNSTINSIYVGAFGGNFDGNSGEGINNIPGISISSGVISIPKSYILAGNGQFGWAVPGNVMCWGDETGTNANYQCAEPFTITDISQSGSNILVTTSLSSSVFPSWSGQQKLFLQVWPVAAAMFTNVVGTNTAKMLSLPDCFGLPIFTCYVATYNNASSAGTFTAGWPMWGTIAKMEYNVNPAYLGATSPANVASLPSLFGTFINSSFATVSYLPTVNLAQLGDRTFDATGGFPASWVNPKTGDTLPSISVPLSEYYYIQDAITNLSGDMANPFSVTVKQFTNPGVTFP